MDVNKPYQYTALSWQKERNIVKNGPKGTLIARKNTNKRSVIEKYATDCHSLSQFLNGCMPDIDDIFKPASRRDTVNTGAAPNTPASVSRVEGVTMQSEISTN